MESQNEKFNENVSRKPRKTGIAPALPKRGQTRNTGGVNLYNNSTTAALAHYFHGIGEMDPAQFELTFMP